MCGRRKLLIRGFRNIGDRKRKTLIVITNGKEAFKKKIVQTKI